MIYGTANEVALPNLDVLTLLFESEHCRAHEHTALHAEAHDPLNVITKSRARSLAKNFAHFLRNSYSIGAAGPGTDIVVTVSTGQSALACLFYGVVAAGGVYSAASASGTPNDIARQIKDGPGKIIVCSESAKPLALQGAKLAGLPERNVLVLKSYPEVELESADGALRCDFKQSLSWEVVTDPKVLADRTVCILYSSGTTGLPKGVLISHANFVGEVFLTMCINRGILEDWDRQGKGFVRRTIGHLPTAHVAGVQGYFVNPFFEGAIVYWMPSFNLDDFIRYVDTLGVTYFFTVPPILAAIAKHPAIKTQFSAIRTATGGAAPLSKEIQQAASGKFAPGAHVTQVWGLSETTGAVTHAPLTRTDTLGSLSPLLPNVTLRLVDDDGNDVRPGEPGEALVKGPMVTKGYHNNPEANKNAFTSDGWFRTGDILRIENGLLYIVDRKKELIKYKALQIAPAELEGVLLANSSVADAAVIGIAQDGTEVPRAYVVLTEAARGKVSKEEIADYVKSEVASYKQLRGGVVFMDAVPRSPAGKILRKELRDAQRKEAQQSKL